MLRFVHTCRFFLPTNSAQYQSARSLESINVKKVSRGEGQAGCTFFFFLFCKHLVFVKQTCIDDGRIWVGPRFFDQVGPQTTNASIWNEYFFTKLCHRHTYKNYEQSGQKSGTFLVNKVCTLNIKVFEKFHNISWFPNQISFTEMVFLERFDQF